MENNNWNPGHSLNKGYPYNGIESVRMFKHRPVLQNDENNKILILVETHHYPDLDIEKWTPQDQRTAMEDFLLHRLFDFQETLKVAEGQLFDILEEKPFIPEDYGFKVKHKNEKPTDPPVRIYVSKFNDNYSLFRKPGENTDPSMWTLLIKKEDNTFEQRDLLLPCDRIAYAVFYALMIPVTEKQGNEGTEGPVKEDAPVKKSGSFDVLFKRFVGVMFPEEEVTVDGKVLVETTHIERRVTIEAQNESDALTRAKFHLETNPDESFADVKLEELSIV